MNLDNLLRDYAREDLKRFTPDAHYGMGRDHNPIADRELVKPLLFEPVRFGLTPRERVAATALDSLATYEIESRAIWDRAHPARDYDDSTEPPGMTFDDERQIWGRRECFRASALVYARMLRDEQLIERFQTPEPPPAIDTAPAAETGQDAQVVEVPASEPSKIKTVTHTTKTPRRDTLTPVIELAQNQCRNQKDTAEVWARLLVLAESKSPPLIGATEEGLQYLKHGTAAIFKRDDLRKRLTR